MDPLFESLVAWVKTFDSVNACKSVKSADDFKDGILIAQCLNKIDCDHFDEEWMSKIKTNTNKNRQLKLLNLKKIFNILNSYYSDVLNHSLSGFTMPNLNLIFESTNASEVEIELSHLLQLVLGCAVNCRRKSVFIKNIMEMNEFTQHMLMNAIQDLISKDIARSSSTFSFGSASEDNGQLKKTVFELNRVCELKDDLDRKCRRLDKQVSELQDVNTSQISEIEVLRGKLQAYNEMVDTSNDDNIQLKLQNRLEELQEKFYDLEAEKDKYLVQFEALQLEQKLLMEKNVKYKKLAHNSQVLQDEIDVLKHASDKVEKLESTIESYKIKMEEMVDLKKQMKQVEENNTRYLEKIFEMEEKVKKISTLKSQIEMYKKKIQELHEQVLNDKIKSKKLEYEYKEIEDTHRISESILRSERDRIQNELGRLKETHELLLINSQTFQSDGKINNSSADVGNQLIDGPFSSAELVIIPSEIKEKVIKLYHENKVLKSKQNVFSEEQFNSLKSQYDDEKKLNADLKHKLNKIGKFNIESEYHLTDLRKKSESSDSGNNLDSQKKNAIFEGLKLKLSQMQMKVDQVTKRSKDSDAIITDLQSDLRALMHENNEIIKDKNKELQKKQREIEESKKKLKSYLEKAKIVIRSSLSGSV